MNYGHRTGYNLLPTDADGSISPDILSMVHKAKDNFINSKQPLPKLNILRFQKGSAISQYAAYTAVLCSSDQTGHSYLVSRAALRKMAPQNYPMGSKMNSDGPQRTPVCPQGHKMVGFGQITAIFPIPKIQ
jgi:hypothetical protein